jgi:hypothetical protein
LQCCRRKIAENMFRTHLACQAAFDNVQPVWCQQSDPLYFTSYLRDLRPKPMCALREAKINRVVLPFWSAHHAECRRSPALVIREIRGTSLKCGFARYVGHLRHVQSAPDTVPAEHSDRTSNKYTRHNHL